MMDTKTEPLDQSLELNEFRKASVPGRVDNTARYSDEEEQYDDTDLYDQVDLNDSGRSQQHDNKHALSRSPTESSLSTAAAADFTNDDVNDITDVRDESTATPANTLRMWVLTLCITTVISGVDALFQLRYPTVTVSNVVAILVSWPLGVAWHRFLPKVSIPVGFGNYVDLNPGPFTRKEHACVLMFTNVCIATGLTNTLVVEQVHYFNVDIGVGRVFYLNLVCYLISWGWMGLAENVLIKPPNVAWPGVLGQIALISTVDQFGKKSTDNKIGRGAWGMSRMSMFAIVAGASFVYYWISGFVFTALAYIGAFISWANPDNATLSQVFGVSTGLGVFPLALDWSQISNLSNPLLVPFWAASCLFGSFVFWAWIILPALYYTNTWQTAHFPIMTNKAFTTGGTTYDFSKIVDDRWRLDETKYLAYGPLMLPAAFILNSALGVASFTAMILSFALNWRRDVWEPIKNRNSQTDRHNVLMRRYKRVSKWLYIASMIAGLVLGIVYCEVWKSEVQLTGGAFVVAIVLCASFFVPLALVEARANFVMTLNSFLGLVSSFWLKGQPIACMYFVVFGYGTLQHALHQSESAKIGHYLKVPPRLTAVLLFLSGVWSSLVNGAVTYWALKHTPHICTSKAQNNFVCRKAQTTFNQHAAWGLLGDKLFAAGGRYAEIYYFIIAVVALCLLVFTMQRRYPGSKWRLVNPVLLVASGTAIPLNTGVNFSSWFVVATLFGYVLHKKQTRWWRKYNMITAVALDAGVAVAVIIIYFCITYPGGASGFSWWGNTVQSRGCDAKGCPHLSIVSLVKPVAW
ncbi:hypothetical protein DB88DRAFT_475907 [Papiliotrema laurentii]|uniref:Oligopeptide transporter n=1 Tax=Papiliotrema laurentii TaxID=5418 RepID=A0AAD9FV98_PAPLA|nr:hypothetical protein DB88DRAFT_475907 [Papiliotrema laurentii]